jgi:hypothetical protein
MNDIRICKCGTHIDADQYCNGENYGGYVPENEGQPNERTVFVCDACWAIHFDSADHVEGDDPRVAVYLGEGDNIEVLEVLEGVTAISLALMAENAELRAENERLINADELNGLRIKVLEDALAAPIKVDLSDEDKTKFAELVENPPKSLIETMVHDLLMLPESERQVFCNLLQGRPMKADKKPTINEFIDREARRVTKEFGE